METNSFRNVEWTFAPTTYTNNGVLDSLHSAISPKVAIASNGDIWVAGKYLYKCSKGYWSSFRINDAIEKNREYKNIYKNEDNLVTVVANILPASQTISIKGNTELLEEIEIVNLQGETLIKVEYDYNNVSIRPFANGVYFVKKTLKDRRIHHSKFIKQ